MHPDGDVDLRTLLMRASRSNSEAVVSVDVAEPVGGGIRAGARNGVNNRRMSDSAPLDRLIR